MRPLLFDIKRYAINDGPGIRITLFLKGCPLSCLWCHNPESISPKQQKLYAKRRCIGCSSCVDSCPNGALQLTQEGVITDATRCTLCGRCAEVCPTMAMEMSGKVYTPEALLQEIEKERLFMDQSGGGVTFCGGEPLFFPDFLTDLLRRCGERAIHRAVDTTLYASTAVVDRVMAETDLFLIDLKVMDSERHRRFCGVGNERILSNIRHVATAGKPYIIRIPMIEGVNCDNDNIEASAAFIDSLTGEHKTVHLLPYHDIGKGKHERLGTRYNPEELPMTVPSEDTLQRWMEALQQGGIEAIIGG
ncbi:glycyl-radical enzyme activating protein [Parabacteroides sp. OttesenSCG-928-N08]|nr:glycyl-radical enzyme activating protein [Parabacteroides sp. OttesenSCG-928-N08]